MKSPLAASPRFPALRSSEQGESAPKARLRSIADGNRLIILDRLQVRRRDGVLKVIRVLDIPVCERRKPAGKSAGEFPRRSIEAGYS